MKKLKKVLSSVLATAMMFSVVSFNAVSVSAAPTICAGWNETLYAEWVDSNPDSEGVVVGYKLSADSEYTYLAGNDHTYLIREASTSGYGRVDIPGLKEGRYDIYIKGSDGVEHTRKGVRVYEYDRSGYAHFNATTGVGAYNDDGTLKDNAVVVYVTNDNRNTVEIPGYEGHEPVSYTSSSTGATWTRPTAGIGNILNNNHKFIREVTGTDNHPLVIRFIGEVTPPENLTPFDQKTNELGGSSGDNGFLAITKYAKNVTIEGIGADAVINGWGFTFSQTSTCPTDAGENIEVRNLTFKNYPEDALGFQGDDPVTCPIKRVWVHNNTFYPGYCANPAESDKANGDGSCDFKRGQYYTMSYNHYTNCHKTNLLGAGDSNDQFYMSLHHNWYENVETRQPLAAGGNVHIYNTYFDGATSTTIDLRGKAAAFSEANYFKNCKNAYKLRKSTSNIKTFNDLLAGTSKVGSLSGSYTVASTREQQALPANGLNFPNGDSIANWDINPTHFYYDAVNNKTDVAVLNEASEVPEYVTTYAGTLKAFPETESGEIIISVTSGGAAVADASVFANGLTFKNNGDGTYKAVASLGAEYLITVSKEGYSNQYLVPAIIENDGQLISLNADLAVDYDGYAVVKLVGGSTNAVIKGATVALEDGTALVEQADGTYKSEAQLAVGTYNVIITNTGDYVAPASAQTITVRTTDAATEIYLDKVKGAVSVSLVKDPEATEEFDPALAKVSVGETVLAYEGNGVFTGEVEVNELYDVYASLTGWKINSITPAQISATKDGVASAEVVMAYKGKTYTWDITNGTNTDNFFVIPSYNEWSSAKNNPQTYEGLTLTKAIKMQSSTTITFEAPAEGELALVMEASDGSTVDLNGIIYSVSTGTTIIPINEGTNVLKKKKNETHLYLLQYCIGGFGEFADPDEPGESTTEPTTETTTEEITNATPVELGEAVTVTGTGISVVYNEATDSWTLTDSSEQLAAELTIPLAAPITSGKVVVKGKATPSSENSKWSFARINGLNSEGAESELAALASDTNKMINLRTDGVNYATSSLAISAGQTYEYKFIIDLDNKTVSLTVNGKTFEGTTTLNSITSFYSVTSVSGKRNVTVTVPYIAIIQETATLSDEIMWDVSQDIVETSSGLSVGEAFKTNSEEDGPREFIYEGNTYLLENWVQPTNNPLGSNGYNPANTDYIPVSGGYMQYDATESGTFTMAVKTGGDKITYVVDNSGNVILSIDNMGGSTRYDIVKFAVEEGKTYYIYAGGSKTCLYYLGFTSGDEPIETGILGDANCDNQLTAADASFVLQYVLNSEFNEITEQGIINSKVVDGEINASTAAAILQKVLVDTYEFPILAK